LKPVMYRDQKPELTDTWHVEHSRVDTENDAASADLSADTHHP
jgi:hypothetical protein